MATILIVDDDIGIRRLLQVWLEHDGHTVVEAGDGNRALQLCSEVNPDLVITDIFMPDKEGLGLIRQLRVQRSRAKIIAMTGGCEVDSSDPLVIAETLGAYLTIRKPFTGNQFLEAVARILRGSSAY